MYTQFTITALATLLLGSASATPVTQNEGDLKRGDLTVAFFDNINYSGRSYGYTGNWNECHNMPSYMDKKASSVSMGYTTGCRIWDAPDCKELSYYLAGGQDWKNLDTVGWNDFARSFSCTPA